MVAPNKSMEPALSRIVVVEDETFTRHAIALALREAGFQVTEAADAYACRAVLKTAQADVVVLDLGLPGLDGMAFAAELRAISDVGLVIVTQRAAPEARIQALDLGADDYLIKPVHLGELAARIRSVLRRRRSLPGQVKRLGRWLIDLDARTVAAGDRFADLTRGEFDILARLMDAKGKIVSREALLHVTSRRPDETDVRSVDALISRLRRKLAEAGDDELILTSPGFGYRLKSIAEDA